MLQQTEKEAEIETEEEEEAGVFPPITGIFPLTTGTFPLAEEVSSPVTEKGMMSAGSVTNQVTGLSTILS